MPLAWQNVALPFNRGIDTKSDDKSIDAPDLADLQNGVFAKSGAIVKRNGYTALPRTISGGGEISSAAAIDTLNDELLLFDNANLYSYSPAGQAWLPRGRATSCKTSLRAIVGNSFTQTLGDMATLNGINVYVWMDSRSGGTIRYSVIDSATGTFYVADSELGPIGDFPTQPSVVANSVCFFLFWHASVGGNSVLRCRRILPATPGSLTAVTSARPDVGGSNYAFDVIVYNDAPLLTWYDSSATGAEVKLQYVTNDGLPGVPGNGFPAAVSVACSTRPSLALRSATSSEGANLCTLFASNASGFVRAYTSAFSLVYALSGNTLTDVIAPDPGSFTLNCDVVGVAQEAAGSNSLKLSIAWSYIGNSEPDRVWHAALRLASSSTLVSSNLVAYSVVLSHKAFVRSGVTCLMLCVTDPLQASYYSTDTAGNVLTKTISGNGGVDRRPNLGHTVEVVSGKWAFSALQRTQLQSTGNAIFSATGVSECAFNFLANGRFQSAQLGGALYVLGGTLMCYDGVNYVEDGFNLFPLLDPVPVATGTGSMSAGTYSYRAVFAWTDNLGRIHRSAPSLPWTVTLVGGSTTQAVLVSMPSCQLTQKKNITAEIYRTKSTGTIYYKSVTTPNVPTSSIIAVYDTTSDSDLGSRETLYTSGGVLDNDPPPQLCAIASTKNRLVGLASEDPSSVYYSKEFFAGANVGWSLALTKPIPAAGDAATAIGVLDDKVIIFKPGRMFFFAGDGPNNAGLDDQFTPLQLISADVGCANPDSLALTSQGLMFQSAKGIRMLDRSIGLQDVGSNVYAYRGEKATSAVLVPDSDQVRFTSATGRALVYDTYWQTTTSDQRGTAGQWSTFTNHSGMDAIVWRNTYAYLRNNATVYIEKDGTFLDDGQFFPLIVTTAWLRFAGDQGYMRCRRANVLGSCYSPHVIQTQIAYDYGPYVTTLSYNTATLGLTSWGGDVTWGSGSLWGGSSDAVYQIRLNPSRQKCQAIRFTFQDLANPGNVNAGQAYALNSLALEIGAKKGLFKLGTSKTGTV